MKKPTDRDQSYMKQMWGTLELITDYNNSLDKRVIQEVDYDDANVISEKDCNCNKTFILSE